MAKKETKKLITIDEALALIEAHYGRKTVCRQTIYNKINLKMIERFGPRHQVLLDEAQVRAVFCSGKGVK